VAIFDQVAGKQFGAATNAIVQLVGLMYYLFADGRIFTRAELTTLLTKPALRTFSFTPCVRPPAAACWWPKNNSWRRGVPLRSPSVGQAQGAAPTPPTKRRKSCPVLININTNC
jgi:hypothetical protein